MRTLRRSKVTLSASRRASAASSCPRRPASRARSSARRTAASAVCGPPAWGPSWRPLPGAASAWPPPGAALPAACAREPWRCWASAARLPGSGHVPGLGTGLPPCAAAPPGARPLATRRPRSAALSAPAPMTRACCLKGAPLPVCAPCFKGAPSWGWAAGPAPASGGRSRGEGAARAAWPSTSRSSARNSASSCAYVQAGHLLKCLRPIHAHADQEHEDDMMNLGRSCTSRHPTARALAERVGSQHGGRFTLLRSSGIIRFHEAAI